MGRPQRGAAREAIPNALPHPADDRADVMARPSPWRTCGAGVSVRGFGDVLVRCQLTLQGQAVGLGCNHGRGPCFEEHFSGGRFA